MSSFVMGGLDFRLRRQRMRSRALGGGIQEAWGLGFMVWGLGSRV